MQIVKFVIITILFFNTTKPIDHPFTIMIDPSGDAKHTGRLIHDTLERGISLQCAESLKKELMKEYKNLRVVLTRLPGETIKPLQNASFANRLDVDLYLSIYFYHEHETPAYITIYHYVENPITDFWHKPIDLCFYHVDQAHLINLQKTKEWGNQIIETLKNKTISPFFEPHQLFGIPFKPLLGIKAPALAIEVGLRNKEDWKHIISPLINALEKVIA